MPTNCENEGFRDRGGGLRVSCSVNRMRKAYYFYSMPYDGAVCSHCPNCFSHLLMLCLVLFLLLRPVTEPRVSHIVQEFDEF